MSTRSLRKRSILLWIRRSLIGSSKSHHRAREPLVGDLGRKGRVRCCDQDCCCVITSSPFDVLPTVSRRPRWKWQGVVRGGRHFYLVLFNVGFFAY